MRLVSLLVCTPFVLLLLRSEARRSRGISFAVWIPTLWMLMAASRPLSLWFGVAGDNASGSGLDQFVLSSLTIIGVFLILQRRLDWQRVLAPHTWLLVLIAYMLVSIVWSEIPLIALRRWLREVVIVVVMGLMVASEANPRQALEAVFRRTAYILLPFSVVLVKYYPLLGRRYTRWSGVEMWIGVATQKNELGRLCMISIFFLFWSLFQPSQQVAGQKKIRKWPDICVIAIGIYLMQGADSSTSLATLIVGTTVFLGMRVLWKSRIMIPQAVLQVLVVFLVIFGTSGPFMGGTNFSGFSSTLGRDETLTGRTEVWKEVLPVVHAQPFLGAGFGSFWTDERRKLYDIPTAHNGYLDVLLEFGGVGLALYTVWLLSLTGKFHRAAKQDHSWATFTLCLLIMGLIYNNTESALNSLPEQMTAVVVLASLVPTKFRRPALTHRKSERSVIQPSTGALIGSGPKG